MDPKLLLPALEKGYCFETKNGRERRSYALKMHRASNPLLLAADNLKQISERAGNLGCELLRPRKVIACALRNHLTAKDLKQNRLRWIVIMHHPDRVGQNKDKNAWYLLRRDHRSSEESLNIIHYVEGITGEPDWVNEQVGLIFKPKQS